MDQAIISRPCTGIIMDYPQLVGTRADTVEPLLKDTPEIRTPLY